MNATTLSTKDCKLMLEELRPYFRTLNSIRGVQRLAALWIAVRFKADAPEIPRELLRTACRELKAYDTDLFNYYMADTRKIRNGRANAAVPWFAEVPERTGWNLTRAGRAEAVRRFA